jgi:hypothetical protein
MRMQKQKIGWEYEKRKNVTLFSIFSFFFFRTTHSCPIFTVSFFLFPSLLKKKMTRVSGKCWETYFVGILYNKVLSSEHIGEVSSYLQLGGVCVQREERNHSENRDQQNKPQRNHADK